MLLKFKSIKFKPGGENETYTCSTEILDTGIIGYYKNDWSRDSTWTWGHKRNDDRNGIQDHNFLGACAKEFRPYDLLEFQVVLHNGRYYGDEVTPHGGPYPLCDDLEICYLRVTFGNTPWNRTESSIWKWGNRWDDGNEEGEWK